MGVKNFNKTLKQQGCRFDLHPLQDYNDKVIVVDISLYLHKFYNAQGSIFVGLFHQLNKLLIHGITPIYIFDGEYHDLKSKEIEKRKQKQQYHQAQKKKLEDANVDKSTIQLHENRSFRITQEILDWCFEFFEAFGIPYIIAKGEADELCSTLVKMGVAHACLSDDTDMFAYGCPNVLRNLKNGMVQQCTMDEILQCLQLQTPQQLTQLCVLLGNDYCTNIPSIGHITAVKMMHQHKNIHAIHASMSKKDIPPEIFTTQLEALGIYTTMSDTENILQDNITKLAPAKAWMDWMVSKVTVPKVTIPNVDNAIEWACKQQTPQHQRNLIQRIRTLDQALKTRTIKSNKITKSTHVSNTMNSKQSKKSNGTILNYFQ